MLIKSIKLRNFRQYKKAEIVFSKDPEKNVTVIIGENGYGKTTLVRAFVWCLYRDNKQFGNSILLNDDVARGLKNGGEEKVSVTLDLDHAGHSYRITTTEIYRKGFDDNLVISSKASTHMIRDGYPMSSSEVELEIESILKKDVKDYFFYDGENNSIENMSKRSSLKSAVSQMMGIKRLENMRSYFTPSSANGVIKTLTKQLTDTDLGLKPLQDQLDDAVSERNKAKNKVEENEKEIAGLVAQRDEKQKVIDANKDVQEDQEKLKRLNNSVKVNQSKIDDKFELMMTQFNGKNNGFLKMLFANCYSSNKFEKLKDTSSFGSKESLSYIREEVIDQLIERGYCLCGAVIKDKNDAYNHLIEAKSHMEPHDYGKYLSDFCTTEGVNVEGSKVLTDSINNSADKFLQDIEDIEADKENIEEIKSRISGRQDIGQYQKDVDTINKSITYLEGINNYIKSTDLPKYEKQITYYTGKIAAQAEDSKNNQLIKRCIAYAERIYNETDKKITKARKETRRSLENEVNDVFSQMYHGSRKIQIDDDFNIITLTNNSKLDNSTGTETVKNFAFVAGLLKEIKNSVLLEEYEDKAEESYPLVLDAPFSDTDEEHIKNICHVLPQHCDQLIIVIMKHHYDLAQDNIVDRVGKIWQIEKHSETYDTIEEVTNV